MLQSLNLLRKLRITPHVKSVLYFSTESSNNVNRLEFQHNYDDKQIEKILNTINSLTKAQLCDFQISKQRVQKIEARKQKQGAFSSIEDILELDGFGVKVLEKFCESILATNDVVEQEAAPREDEKQVLLSLRKQQFVSPNLLEKCRKTITSCVSFHIDLNYVAWTKLSFDSDSSEPARVEEWMCYQTGNDDKKLSLSDLIQIALHIDSKVPDADVYVVEAAPTPQAAKQPNNPMQLSINLQKSQILAMLSILMASRGARDSTTLNESQSYLDETDQLQEEEEFKMRFKRQQKLFILRNFVASRLYKTFVGNERVSTQSTVERILRSSYSYDQPQKASFDSLDVPQHLREYYRDSKKLDREFMGQSLLNGLTFMKLCVMKCPHSIATLNKRR